MTSRGASVLRAAIGAGALLLCGQTGRSATLTVVNTNDSGAGSLRQAILDANAVPGPHTIAFAIPGAGVHTISPSSPLPAISSNGVTVNGYSQPGSAPNIDPFGDNAVLQIDLDGALVPAATGLSIAGGAGAVQGLVIGRFATGIAVSGANAVISGNFIGTSSAGAFAAGNTTGVALSATASGGRIGGPAAADRNVISANGTGVLLDHVSSGVVQGNLIGLTASGNGALGNVTGIHLDNATNTTIGPSGAGPGNLIAGNSGDGIHLTAGSQNVMAFNFIGTNISGTIAIGNQDGISIGGGSQNSIHDNIVSGNRGAGIRLVASYSNGLSRNLVGTDASGALPLGNATAGVISDSGTAAEPNDLEPDNVIAFNGVGVWLTGGGAIIRRNSIHSNHGLGIVIGGTPTLIPNQFPIITSVVSGGGSTTIQGRVRLIGCDSVVLDFYSNAACAPRPHEFDEGRTWLGGQGVPGVPGDNAFSVTLPVTIQPGERVTVAATHSIDVPCFSAGRGEGTGEGTRGGFTTFVGTSEFSQRLPFAVTPPAGSPSGAPVTIHGTDFEAGAVVDVGGVAATGVSVVDSQTIQATMPAFPAGSVKDVTVTDPDSRSGTLRNGWVVDFADVLPSSPFEPFVVRIAANSIAAGCGTGNFCPNDPVTRAQMAVFLLASQNGICYQPPPALGTVFSDVPAGSFAASWIEALAAANITTGCGGGRFCPGSPVTRAQMAVFLLRTQGGPAYVPPPCVTPTFADVPCSSGFAAWVDELHARGITAGCGGGLYCPGDSVSRSQMAVFLVTTFGLPS